MENENETCGVCSCLFNSKDHTPRVLINCGHTLCSSCLIEILKKPKLRKCPFDNNSFKRTQKAIENFPTNFALLAVIEGRNQQDLCKIHQKKLVLICLQDNVKICSDCEGFGEHKGHLVRKIEDLKAKGIKTKNDLEESLMKFEKNNEEVEKSKKRWLGKLGSRFGEIHKILRSKQNQVENLIERNMGHSQKLSLKREAETALEEIDQVLKNEENLAVLDKDFSSIFSRLQPSQGTKLLDENSRMMSRLESFLVNETNSINSFDLSNEKGKPPQPPASKEKEKQQQLSSKAEHKFFKSIFTVEKFEESLLISIKTPTPRNQTIDLHEFNKMKRVNIELGRYNSLSQGSTDLTFLSEIFQTLNRYTSLKVVFTSLGLNDCHALQLFDLLFYRIQHLKEIEICLKNCKITNEPLLFFCNNILPRATSLSYFTLQLGHTQISDLSLIALAKALSPFSKNLKEFLLGVENTGITDDGIEKIFGIIEGVRTLRLYLDGTGITDRSLKLLGEKKMPVNLEKFSLDVSETKITMEGVTPIFTGVPKDIGRLSLSFEGIKLSDEVISLFERTVCPKLGVVEDVHLRLEGRELREKASRLLEKVRKETEDRRIKENK